MRGTCTEPGRWMKLGKACACAEVPVQQYTQLTQYTTDTAVQVVQLTHHSAQVCTRYTGAHDVQVYRYRYRYMYS